MIYFLTCQPWGLYPVKIGWARIPASALAEAQPWCPFKLGIFAVTEGDRAELRRLLDLFQGLRLEGDWFYAEGVVKDTMKRALLGMGDPPGASSPPPPRLRTALRYAEILSEIQWEQGRAPMLEEQEEAERGLRG